MYCTWNASQHAVKRDIGSESWFLSTRPTFDAPVRGVLVGILPWRLVGKNQNSVATQWWKNFENYSFWQNVRTWWTHTDRQTLHDSIGRTCIASRGKKQTSAIEWLCLVAEQSSAAVWGDACGGRCVPHCIRRAVVSKQVIGWSAGQAVLTT